MVSPDVDFGNPLAWPDIHAQHTGPPPVDPSALAAWIHLQYVPTRQDADLEEAVDALVRRHVGRNRRWLAVDGEATIGKSDAVTAVLLRRAMTGKRTWYRRTDTGSLYVPYVYVVATSPSTADLLRDVCAFLGLPTEGKEHDLLKRLRDNLPRLGTIVIVVDEAQMLRRKSAGASTVTDNLRNVVHLPVPFVFVGVDLGASALLRDWGANNDTVRQLRRRHDMLALKRLVGPSGVEQINTFVTAFGRRMSVIENFGLSGLAHPAMLAELAIRSEGRPGAMLEILKSAAVCAIHGDGDLSADRIDECLPEPAEPSVLRGATP